MASPIGFLGRRTLQKMYLMLHLGRMLCQRGAVRLDTVNASSWEETVYDFNGVEVHEHPSSQHLQEVLMKSGKPGALEKISLVCEQEPVYGIHARADGVNDDNAFFAWFVDIEDVVELVALDAFVLVTDPDRVSVEIALALAHAWKTENLSGPLFRVYLDLCRGSRISFKYLERLLSRQVNGVPLEGDWFALQVEETNTGVILDNQHDDRLLLHGLSPSYHALLKGIASVLYQIPFKESAKCIRMADKGLR